MRPSSAAWLPLLLCGCLEGNPDWDRPGEAGEASESNADSSADTTTEVGTEAGSQGSMSTGDGDASDTTTTTGDGDGDTTTSGDGDGSTSSTTGDGDSINECTFADAVDMRGMPTVTITDISTWDPGHRVCVIVDAGTTVRWESQSFTAHPVLGGESGMLDPDSPITQGGPGVSNTPLQIILADAGTYPYYCELHPMNMFGVIYVV